MQRNLTIFIATALMLMTATGFAQSTDQTAQPTAAQASQKDPADKSLGQDLVNPNAPANTNPPTVGQNKTTGNNLVGANKTGQMPMSARPDFKTIDMKNHGYVLASEVRNSWLKQNFSKCDTDGDGKVTTAEYGICSKQ